MSVLVSFCNGGLLSSPKNISMTAFTDLLFFGFTSTSNKTQSLFTKAMENLNKTNLKNIFRDLASI